MITLPVCDYGLVTARPTPPWPSLTGHSFQYGPGFFLMRLNKSCLVEFPVFQATSPTSFNSRPYLKYPVYSSSAVALFSPLTVDSLFSAYLVSSLIFIIDRVPSGDKGVQVGMCPAKHIPGTYFSSILDNIM